jgi:uncharacterized membrane protein
MKASFCFSLAVIAVLCAASSFAQAAASCRSASHYKIVPLPLHPARINNSDTIVGATEDQQAATWTQGGGMHELAIPAGFSGVEPMGFNEAGDIVGQVTAKVGASQKTQAFAYIRGKFKILTDAQSKAKAINNAGEIAVEQSPGGPFVWSADKTTALGGCCSGRVFAINNRGQIAGEIDDREGRYSAFVWDPKRGLETIAPPDARTSTALAINDSGHVLLQSLSPNQIFLREEGKLTPVELSPEYASQPLALNDCDFIVGEYGASSDYYRAFIWDKKNGFRDLNKLVDKSEGWVLESALDINSRGEIVGTGDRQNQSDVGFLLVPENTK